LNEDTRSLVGLVDQSFNARRLLEQSLFIYDARVRIDRRAWLLGVDRRGESDETGDRNRSKDETCSRQ
jgi:hypothetical protein